MRAGLTCLAGLGAVAIAAATLGPAWSQGVTTTLDLSGMAARVKAAQDAAEAAQGAIPQPCGTIPAADTLSGSVGSGSCFARPSDTRPTAVQAAVTNTDTTGAWTITWAKPFASQTPYINPQPINPIGAQPMTCNVTASTAIAASGRCWMQNVMNTPGLAVSLLNLQIVGAAASIQVRVAGRDLTQ